MKKKIFFDQASKKIFKQILNEGLMKKKAKKKIFFGQNSP